MWLFDKFKSVPKEGLNETYGKLHTKGEAAIADFDKTLAAAEKTRAPKTKTPAAAENSRAKAKLPTASQNQAKAISELKSEVSTAEAALKTAQASKAKDAAAKIAEAEGKLATATDKYTNFLRGSGEHEITIARGKKVAVSVSEPVKKSFVEAEEAARKVSGPAGGRFGILRTQKDGFTKALEHNANNMNFFKEGLENGARAKAFGHAAVSVGAVGAMGDAIFRSKTKDGEDRSAMGRLAEFVVGGGVGTVALLGGRVAAVAR